MLPFAALPGLSGGGVMGGGVIGGGGGAVAGFDWSVL
jgi:hypothetical protein